MTQRPDGRFFYDRKNEKEEIFMAKNQAQAAEQASKEKTAAQLPVDVAELGDQFNKAVVPLIHFASVSTGATGAKYCNAAVNANPVFCSSSANCSAVMPAVTVAKTELRCDRKLFAASLRLSFAEVKASRAA